MAAVVFFLSLTNLVPPPLHSTSTHILHIHPPPALLSEQQLRAQFWRKKFFFAPGEQKLCTSLTTVLPQKSNIHPASRGVAAHTASLFRSVRGAKGGFPPWGLPKLRIFTSPPPAKADIATAILTNVIEHLVLLLPPNKHAVLYTFVARQPVENIMFDNASNSLISPTVENTAIYSVFFNFSIFQCR